ncbi:MAG: glycoside hydrolase family 5 protein [Clostridia bacterium]|nr:glycoside hydrolase family 5 protein [Clostridia bacterium]
MNRKLSLILVIALCLSIALPALAGNAQVPVLTITQRPIPDNEAMAFLKKMGVGWNLGNTFDATKGDWNRNADEMTVESSWVGVLTTQPMIQAIHDAGFSTIRIPVSWHDHVDAEYTISEKWLNRVQEVLDWAYEAGMCVILNIHHDEEQFLPTSAHYEESARYMQAIWTQLAARFRDYDERLIFESFNEPRILGHANEWWFNSASIDCRDAADCINRLNQLFVDTVRASGGNNETRYLMVPGYDASPDGALTEYFKKPADTADNRIIISVHAYTPYAFALQLNGGTTEFGSQSQKQEIVSFMNRLYDRYIKNGEPVVIGEYGALNKFNNLQSRVDFTAFYAATASARNLPAVWWDNGSFSGGGENFGLLDRRNVAIAYPEIVEAIMTYGGYDKLPAAQ